jgi:hypothetical protein
VLKLAGAVAAAVVIVGCAGSDGGSADTTSPPVATDATEATSSATAPPATDAPTKSSTDAPAGTDVATTTEEPVAESIPAPEATTVGELLALDRPVMLAHAGGDFDGAERFPEHVLDVEIKIPDDLDGEPDLDSAIDIAQALAVEIAELNRTDSVIAVSFSDEAMAAFRTFAPGVATSPGTDTLTAWYAGAEHEFAPQDVVFQAPPFFDGLEVLTAETIDRARADGFGIWAWMDDASTQETTEFYRDLIARGIDGIIASRNSEAVAALTPTE